MQLWLTFRQYFVHRLLTHETCKAQQYQCHTFENHTHILSPSLHVTVGYSTCSVICWPHPPCCLGNLLPAVGGSGRDSGACGWSGCACCGSGSADHTHRPHSWWGRCRLSSYGRCFQFPFVPEFVIICRTLREDTRIYFLICPFFCHIPVPCIFPLDFRAERWLLLIGSWCHMTTSSARLCWW